MTLRVRISIVPFGDETQEREIHQINISNISFKPGDHCRYGVELDKYKTGDYDTTLDHYRSQGALKLVQAVLRDLEREGFLHNKAP